MNAYARWFGGLVLLGVVVNIVLSVLALLIPEQLLAFFNLEPTMPLVWIRFAANLLILLSLFYIPGAINLYHYKANAFLAVFSRLAGFTFFLTQPRDYLLFGLIDITFAIPQAILLLLALRSTKSVSQEGGVMG
ncbi:MAG: hypothetical protein WA919_27350 [Coleofasciculaceae cyanobacterium]